MAASTSKAHLVLLGLLVVGAMSCTSEPEPVADTEPVVTTAMPSTSTSVPAGPKPVIADYSPTVSDVGGLAYLLAHPDVEVVAVTLSRTGEAGCELGLDVTAGILALFAKEHIPIACDDHVPPDAEPWPEDFLAKQVNLRFSLPRSGVQPDPRGAQELIADVLRSSDQPVTIWAVAPMTALSRALASDPSLVQEIEEIVIMGGAVDVPGNVFDSPAEWNLFIDAAASRDVIASGAPVTLVALDATNDVPVPGWLPLAMERAEQSTGLAYIASMVELFGTPSAGFYFMWDELAAAVVAESVEVATQDVQIDVVVEGPAKGQTARSGAGTRVTLATGVADPGAFYDDFVSVLSGATFERPVPTPEEAGYLLDVADALAVFETAMGSVFGPDSPMNSEEYDGVAVAEVLGLGFDAWEEVATRMEAMAPPATLEALHVEFLAELRADLVLRETLLAAVAAAPGFPEAFEVLEGVGDGSACHDLAHEAAFLGVDARLACVG